MAPVKQKPTVTRRSPLRWAGSKARSLPKLLPLIPSTFDRYVEPMAGSAAAFFVLRPPVALLGDTNPELIHFYRTLKKRPDELICNMLSMKASVDMYMELRDSVPAGAIDRALRFAYLNRLCWNGLYRVNREGRFNVPIGDRLPATLWKEHVLWDAASTLQGAELHLGDASVLLGTLGSGDFVLLDPPYPHARKTIDGFARYTADGFDDAAHRQLANAASGAVKRGARVLVTLSARKSLVKHYDFAIRTAKLKTQSLISGESTGRRIVAEVGLLSYTAEAVT